MKRFWAGVLSACMLLCGIQMNTFAAQMTDTVFQDSLVDEEEAMQTVGAAAEGNAVESSDADSVSRIEWLTALTKTFEMTVEEDNYPDNYYSDIDSDYEYYYEVMLATEFGLVDVDAGDPFCPDDAATREFAAHTLNLCLGYAVEEGTEYTFAEKDSVTYADDIQVALNRGWFALADGAFLPKTAITEAEKNTMLADAEAVLASVALDENHENTYKFAEGVIVLPEDTEALLTGENELTFTKCSVELKEGDIFGVVQDDFPIARKVASVSIVDGQMVVQVESVDMTEAFEELDIQGELNVDLAQVQAVDESVELAYVVGGTLENNWEDGTIYNTLEEVGDREISAVLATRSYDIPDAVRKQYNIADGVKANINCTISDVKPGYDSSLFDLTAYFKVDATVTFNCNVSVDVLEAMGIAPSIQLVKVPIGPWGLLGNVTADLEMSFKGSLTLNLVEKVSVGVQFDNGKFRMISEFKKKSFTIQARVEVSAGIKLAANFDVLFLKGSVYGRVGTKAVIELTSYIDGELPVECAHINAWLYASIGASVKVDLGIWKTSWKEEYDIYTDKNSPVRVVFHYEDGVAVEECSRDGVESEDEGDGGSSDTDSGSSTGKKYKYYTPITSQYGYSGASSGLDSNGNTYTIFDYSLDDDGNATITGYNGNVSALNIPDTLDGYPVVGIGSNVFKGNKKLGIVVIPDSVTSIGSNAFNSCTNLSEVIFSETSKLTQIAEKAFAYCYSLEEIDIPDSVTSIDAGAFGKCSKLYYVDLPESLSTLSAHAFYNCDNLTSIEIPKNLKETYSAYLYEFAYDYQYGPFYECDGLKNITFEEGTTFIANGLFANCPGIEEIKMPDTITAIKSDAFLHCDNLKTVEFSDNLTDIADLAFAYCESLEKVNIPNSVTRIGAGSFGACTNLAEANLPTSLTAICAHAFYNCDKLTGIVIPKNLKETYSAYIYDFAYDYQYGPFYGCDGLKDIVFEEGITKIPNGLFANCPGIETMIIPDTVTQINSNAFLNCKNLENITLSSSITAINDYAFYGCSSLNDVDLPTPLTSLGCLAFGNCDGLTSIEISKNVASAGVTDIWLGGGPNYRDAGPFTYCDNLKEVTFEEGTKSIAENLFTWCVGVEKVTIPDTVTEVGSCAFLNCYNLKEVSIADSVETIYSSAFENCNSLQNVTIPDSVTGMGTYVFAGCSSLQSAVLPQSRVNIMAGTFKNCSSLTEVVIPDTVENIRAYAFYNTGLTEVSLPDSVVLIEEYAFAACKALESFTAGEGLTTIEDSAFRSCPALADISLNDKLTSIGQYTFYNCDALESIHIPNSVSSLGIYAFADCELLTDVKLSNSLTYIPAYGFNLCPSLKKIVIPYRVESIYQNAFSNCTKLTEVSIPRATTTVGTNAFSYPTNMTIYGVSGTYAETYANEVGATFVGQEVNATEISLNTETLTIGNGKKATLELSISPDDITDEVSWVSSDTDIVSVSSDGVVTAKNVGTATVKVYVGDLSASCEVTVIQLVTNIYLDTKSVTLEAMETYELGYTVYPATAENKELTWSSEDESIATVDENGVITAVGKGSTTIFATAKDIGGRKSTECTVTVSCDAHICTEVSELESAHKYDNSVTEIWYYRLEGADELKVTFDEQTSMEKNFDFLYVYDNQGQVVGKYTGTELSGKTITVAGDVLKLKLVTSAGGTDWGFKVTTVEGVVKVHATEVALNKESLQLLRDASEKLEVAIEPEDCTDDVIWTSSDETVATVDVDGVVTAVAKGTATITVTVGELSDSCIVTVKNVHICTEATELESTHNYANNAEESWIYTLEGAEILKVTFAGETYLEYGYDYLYVYDGQGNEVGKYTGEQLAGKTITLEGNTVELKLVTDSSTTYWGFKVTEISDGKAAVKVTDITLSETCLELTVAETHILTATVLPDNAKNKALNWSSSNEAVAMVNAEGQVTAAGTGEATITVAAQDGSDISTSCTVIVKEAAVEPEPEQNIFADVSENSWQYTFVKFAVDNGLMKGKGNDEAGKIVFDPNNNMTRAEFVQTLYNKEGKPAVAYTAKFADVPDGQWYTNAIMWAAENNIVAGKGDKFDVNGQITRQEMATILYKYATNYKGYETSGRAEFDGYTDASTISSWATENMRWALNYGIMKGKGDRIAPLENATRAECATMLKNFMNAYE